MISNRVFSTTKTLLFQAWGSIQWPRLFDGNGKGANDEYMKLFIYYYLRPGIVSKILNVALVKKGAFPFLILDPYLQLFPLCNGHHKLGNRCARITDQDMCSYISDVPFMFILSEFPKTVQFLAKCQDAESFKRKLKWSVYSVYIPQVVDSRCTVQCEWPKKPFSGIWKILMNTAWLSTARGVVAAGRWWTVWASTLWCEVVLVLILQHHIVHWKPQTGDSKGSST